MMPEVTGRGNRSKVARIVFLLWEEFCKKGWWMSGLGSRESIYKGRLGEGEFEVHVIED
jgi:hypothetical protein